MVGITWKSGDKLVTSDGRSVTSMRLDVAKSSDEPSPNSVQTYDLICAFDVTQLHKASITVNEQQISIVNVPRQRQVIVNGQIEVITVVWWKPISDPDVEHLLRVFHDVLEAAKPLDDEMKREIREHNELRAYIHERWPNGFPEENP